MFKSTKFSFSIIALVILSFVLYFSMNAQKTGIPEDTTKPIVLSTITESQLPITVTLENCREQEYDTKTCFGSGAELYKTEDNIEVWSRVSTDTLANLGIVMLVNGKRTLSAVTVDFGNHPYTEKEYNESIDSVKELVISAKK